jgi:hypothetical protein
MNANAAVARHAMETIAVTLISVVSNFMMTTFSFHQPPAATRRNISALAISLGIASAARTIPESIALRITVLIFFSGTGGLRPRPRK